jgi:hypothetical protein
MNVNWAAYMGVVFKEAFRAVDMPEEPRLLGSPSDLASPGPMGLQVHKGVSGLLDPLHLLRTVLNNEHPNDPRA